MDTLITNIQQKRAAETYENVVSIDNIHWGAL